MEQFKPVYQCKRCGKYWAGKEESSRLIGISLKVKENAHCLGEMEKTNGLLPQLQSYHTCDDGKHGESDFVFYQKIEGEELFFFSDRLFLTKAFERWAKEVGAKSCVESFVAWLYIKNLIDVPAALSIAREEKKRGEHQK